MWFTGIVSLVPSKSKNSSLFADKNLSDLNFFISSSHRSGICKLSHHGIIPLHQEFVVNKWATLLDGLSPKALHCILPFQKALLKYPCLCGASSLNSNILIASNAILASFHTHKLEPLLTENILDSLPLCSFEKQIFENSAGYLP